jgi:hypothetical protein
MLQFRLNLHSNFELLVIRSRYALQPLRAQVDGLPDYDDDVAGVRSGINF